MPNFVVRFERVLPDGLFRVDVKDEIFPRSELTGFTSGERIRGRLEALLGRQDYVEAVMKRLIEDGGHTIRLDPRHFESYQQFKEFWYAGVPPGGPPAN